MRAVISRGIANGHSTLAIALKRLLIILMPVQPTIVVTALYLDLARALRIKIRPCVESYLRQVHTDSLWGKKVRFEL